MFTALHIRMLYQWEEFGLWNKKDADPWSSHLKFAGKTQILRYTFY